MANCYGCHASAESGGLRVDSREALLKGGDSGPAIVPNHPEASLVVQVVAHTHNRLKMPQGKPKLKDEEIAALSQWVKDGAVWPKESATRNPQSAISKHWAYQPIKKSDLPKVANSAWSKNDIDRFVLAKLEASGLNPNFSADKRTLIRRATFDLTGLPPTPEEIEIFLTDKSPDAYAKVIERLLASPRYGERWARHWLDIARYSDTQGVNDTTTLLYPFAYTYRDWVIRALNEDLPYDQFLLQQIAADRLPHNDSRNLAALGFLTVGRGGFATTTEERIDDKVDVAIRGTMALTVSCARCHNHKFDPIPTADYYSLFSVFANTREPEELPLLNAAAANDAKEAELRKDIAKINDEVEKYRVKRFPELKAEYRKSDQIAKNLLAVHQARDLKKDVDVRALTIEKDYNFAMLRRWQSFLKKAADNRDSVFSIWRALITIPENEFAAKAPAAIADCVNQNINPLVAKNFDKAPATIEEAAAIYGKLLAKFDKAEPLPNADEEALRQVLHGEDSPINVPFASYNEIRLTKDSQFETDQRQKIQRMITARAFDGAAPRAMAVEDAAQLKPAHIYIRGNPNNKGEEVPRRFLHVLAGENRLPFTKGSGRLELAHAIIDRNNPLTARVIVNRVWQWHFGHGLVRTPSDFGSRGEAPTHPELLDYLATWFMENGWSLKKLHALILTSATYQQSSADDATARQLDPENKLLWRMNRQRLDFESLRDAMLAASGQLDVKMGGVPDEITSWPFARRRTVYGYVNRAKLAAEFLTFDFANPDAHVAERYQTTIPQQSLYLMNNPFVVEQARALLKRPEVTAAKTSRQRINQLYQLLYGRKASVEEIKWGAKFVNNDDGTERGAVATRLHSKAAVTNPTRSLPLPVPYQIWSYGQGEYDDKEKKLKSFAEHKFFSSGAWRLNANELDPRRQTAFINREGGVPTGKTNSAIRRWAASFDGKVAISGKLIHDLEQACVSCDGVEAVIVSSRSGAVGNWSAYLSQADTAATIEVKTGDTIDFVALNKKNISGDDFKWQVTIRRGGSTETWDSIRDFYSPLAQPMNVWERYVQALIAAVEFSMID
ncbi:MAG: PSD1 and planctomycete cytochrome C domain-containing protein [Acidobacteriota bacterium]|nr:PSD1 and planctomycete cytochrome C domain-containing protein [Acidobacteriota bacterium]